MAVEPKPVPAFINEIFQTKRIKDVIAEWAAAPEDLTSIIEKELGDMGIYYVYPNEYREHMIDTVIFRLRNSPNIHKFLNKLRMEAKNRDKNRRR